MKTRVEFTGLTVLLIMVAPWLLSPQGGPSPSVLPMLSSAGCAGLLLIFLSLSASGRRMPWTRVLAGAWLVAALVSSVIGLCQYFGVAQYFAFMSPAGVGEAYANLRQRNQFATLTSIGLVALSWWVVQQQGGGQGRFNFWFWHGAAALLATGNAASMSRTGLVQLVLIVSMIVWWVPRQADVRRVLMTAVLAYMAAALVLPVLSGQEMILSRFQGGGPECTSRLTLWSNVLHLTSLRPWLGWGWGELDYAHFMTPYDGARFCEILDNAHNLPLHLAVELGIPLSLLICAGAVWLILRARPWRELDSSRQLGWGVLAVILLHSMLEYPLWYGPFQIALGVCIGLLWPARKMIPALPAGRKETQWGLRVLAAGLLVAVAYAVWDYHRISQIYYPPDYRATAYRENTLEKIRGSWLFRDQVRFAEFTLTPLTRDNAEQLYAMGQQVLHFSPEARVVEKMIEIVVLLGRDEEARFYLERYRAAYPKEHARWGAQQQPLSPSQ